VWKFLKNDEARTDKTLLGIYPKECQLAYSQDTSTAMFIVALITLTKIWNQLRCPSPEEWTKKITHTCTHIGVLFSVKKNEIMSFTGK
jgi:hypothetical protein